MCLLNLGQLDVNFESQLYRIGVWAIMKSPEIATSWWVMVENPEIVGTTVHAISEAQS